MKVVILAGGSGTRLWPLSRKNNPKQAQPFLDSDTLLQKTYRRLQSGFAVRDIYVATARDYVAFVREQLPQLPAENIFAEPCRRDTAAAIGLAATFFYFRNPREVMLTVQADHYIDNEVLYIHTLQAAGRLIAAYPTRGGLIGIQPAYPETGYGYIKLNSQFAVFEKYKIFKIEKFIEKPNADIARRYVSQWGYLWNPGYFIWRVDTLLAQYKQFLPDMYRGLAAINRALGTVRQAETIARVFADCKPCAIEYGILEKAKNLIVMPAAFSFTDIGNWRTVKNVLAKTNGENIIKGKSLVVDSANNLIYNFTERIVSAAGLRDMIVVVTEDAVLVCHQDNAHAVKDIVKKMEEQGLEKYL
jgi:mannose-1-phosphate guanylyltransferase